MKKLLLTLVSPVLALMPAAAHADEKCRLGKQVYEFKPTGKKISVKDLSSKEGNALASDDNSFMKLPPPNYNLKERLPKGTEFYTTKAGAFLKIPDIDGESIKSIFKTRDGMIEIYKGEPTCK
ncbi:hypothetical protein [Ponticaulis profundi]|uniref:Elongation factor P n=1 Tax=Ponticaulis profundi TaxID=2665222 RepID=A0ABW1S5I2_9PROT